MTIETAAPDRTPEQVFNLKVGNLSVSYKTHKGSLRAVDDVSLELEKGKIYALVGESGCGKSTLGLALSRLLPENQVEYAGKILCNDVNLLSLHEDEVEKFRGTQLATIFQEPMTSLNPVYKVGEQVAEALWIRERRSKIYFDTPKTPKPDLPSRFMGINSNSLRRGSRKRLYELFPNVVELFEKVRIANSERVVNMYPHELSGGMKQRVMIAMALAGNPSFLIADEPTTALDVTTQSQILTLIKKINAEFGMGVLMITHDLGVVAAVADFALVMYAGKIVEEAPTNELFKNPMHPYTVGLMASFPRGQKTKTELKTIKGVVPPLGMYPEGCRFNPRCPQAFERCHGEIPQLIEVSSGHKVSCFLYGASAS